MLDSLSDGHGFLALLYLLPAGLLLAALVEMGALAHSFYTTVFK